jgi:hypothetical protein
MIRIGIVVILVGQAIVRASITPRATAKERRARCRGPQPRDGLAPDPARLILVLLKSTVCLRPGRNQSPTPHKAERISSEGREGLSNVERFRKQRDRDGRVNDAAEERPTASITYDETARFFCGYHFQGAVERWLAQEDIALPFPMLLSKCVAFISIYDIVVH